MRRTRPAADLADAVLDTGLDGASLDVAAEKRRELLELFPEAQSEGGRIDFERLRLALGDSVEIGKERYGLTWPGKAECFKTIQAPSMATLLPAPDKSVKFDTTENIIIEGDNLEVLKLLQKSYLGKIKMIYIDPPYNTGNDFIYPDDYSESLETYLQYTRQVDSQGSRFGTNADTDGRFHSKWLSMMYPRLYVARDLLREDGVIFVSIDDGELCHLGAIMDEIFGAEQFIANFVWVKKKKGSHLSKTTRSMTEYIVCYARDYSTIELFGEAAYSDKWQPLAKRTNTRKRLMFSPNCVETALPDGTYRKGPRGLGTSSLTFTKDFAVADGRVTTELDVEGPFVWTQPKLNDEIARGTRAALSRKFGFNVFRYDQLSKIKRPSTLLDQSQAIGTNEDAYDELKRIFGIEALVQYPKPSSLIEFIVQAATRAEPNAVVMDFFAGSGTTAQAVLELNARDGSCRKFILVQLPEPTGRSDYRTITDICEERVRRVIKKLDGADAGKFDMDDKAPLDRGFRVLRLAESNVKEWNTGVSHDVDALREQLKLGVDHLLPGRTDLDIVYEVLLKSGYPLSAKVSTEDIAGKRVYSVADGAFLICLERKLSLELIRAIAAWGPERVLCLDEGFTGSDQVKANAVQTFKGKNITFRTL